MDESTAGRYQTPPQRAETSGSWSSDGKTRFLRALMESFVLHGISAERGRESKAAPEERYRNPAARPATALARCAKNVTDCLAAFHRGTASCFRPDAFDRFRRRDGCSLADPVPCISPICRAPWLQTARGGKQITSSQRAASVFVGVWDGPWVPGVDRGCFIRRTESVEGGRAGVWGGLRMSGES